MNDEMDDFTSKPGVPNMFGLVQGAAERHPTPNKTPLSLHDTDDPARSDGQLVAMIIGSPGGSRIITITLEAILNVIDGHMDIASAIDAPRLHEQWLPDVIEAEPLALSPDTQRGLEAMGYTIKDRPHWGAAAGILVGAPALGATPPLGEHLFGAEDARAPAGAAVGN